MGRFKPKRPRGTGIKRRRHGISRSDQIRQETKKRVVKIKTKIAKIYRFRRRDHGRKKKKSFRRPACDEGLW